MVGQFFVDHRKAEEHFGAWFLHFVAKCDRKYESFPRRPTHYDTCYHTIPSSFALFYTNGNFFVPYNYNMTCSYRALERLPLEIFEKLAMEEEEEDEQASALAAPSLLSFSPSIVLQQRLCNKLKSFSQKVGARIKQKSIHNVGDFLKISETDLVHGLDPLLTFGTKAYKATRRNGRHCRASCSVD